MILRFARKALPLLSLLTITSCSPKIEYVETETVRIDTFIQVQQRIDSFVERDSVYFEVERRADSVIITKNKYIYRDRIKIEKDTIKDVRVDSIPVTIEVEKPLTFREKVDNYLTALLHLLFAFVVLFLAVIIYKKVKGK